MVHHSHSITYNRNIHSNQNIQNLDNIYNNKFHRIHTLHDARSVQVGQSLMWMLRLLWTVSDIVNVVVVGVAEVVDVPVAVDVVDDLKGAAKEAGSAATVLGSGWGLPLADVQRPPLPPLSLLPQNPMPHIRHRGILPIAHRVDL